MGDCQAGELWVTIPAFVNVADKVPNEKLFPSVIGFDRRSGPADTRARVPGDICADRRGQGVRCARGKRGFGAGLRRNWSGSPPRSYADIWTACTQST